MIEVYKDEGWGQLNVRVVPPGAKAGGHRHPRTNEWWFLARGRLEVWLAARSLTMTAGDRILVPKGTGHAVENLDGEDAVLVFWRSTIYDPDDPDKEPWCCGSCDCGVK